jgi:isoleucyl-tRNA synthetase
MKNYSNTLNLPVTSFKMKANLREKEPKLIEEWLKEKIYFKSLDNDDKDFKFHDGPPYANGDIHLGTAFNKVLKDIVLKYKRLKNFNAPFIPGWDTHGLPIELAVTKGELKGDPIELRQKFKNHALKYIDRQRKDFKRLGILADWSNPYITMDPKFESKQLKVFAELVNKGLVYNSLKPVYWCTTTQTALSESEVVYKDHKSRSIYLKFKANIDLENHLNINNIYFAVWTTTPWTLPANLAIALNKDLEYVIFKTSNNENIIFAKRLLSEITDKLCIEGSIIKELLGSELEGYSYHHPFLDKILPIILAPHVSDDAGTGCVHTAPGHGAEDYLASIKYGLEILSPVDGKGYLTSEAGPFKDIFYKDSNDKIIEHIKDKILLVEDIFHSYPYSERGKTPVIFRATKQWFISVNRDFKDDALKQINDINFYPETGKNRLSSMISNRPDWCISRQRVWGLPIPVFYCSKCGSALLNRDLIIEISDIVEKEGSDIFVKESSNYFLKGRYSCCNQNEFIKGKDIFDVWFDSGVSYASVFNDIPVDLYLEGSDQHRGWFQTSLLTSLGYKGKLPYRNIVTHGFVVDGQGMKMSKSIGNVIFPQEIIDKYGADILRLWVGSSDFTGDIKISDAILNQASESYRKIRNFFRFILGNINDFTQYSDDLITIDSLALNRTKHMINVVDKEYKNYNFHTGLSQILNYITEISSFYMDIIKDRLYVHGKDSKNRRSAQYVLKEIGLALSKIISPILSFTAEEVFKEFSDRSIFLEKWPNSNSDLDPRWQLLKKLRDLSNNAIEKLIKDDLLKSSSESSLTLYADKKILALLNEFSKDELKEIFKVADICLVENNGISAEVKVFSGEKCSRCWLYYDKIIEEVCEKCKRILEN